MSEVAVRERLVRWADPAEILSVVRGHHGLEAMRMLVAHGAPPPPIATLMNFTLSEVDDGRVVFTGYPGEEHYNPIGVVHGGFALTLLDSAMGCAVHTKLDAGIGYTSTDTQVRFIRPITRDTGAVRCEGRVVHAGRTTAIAEGTLYDGRGKILATGTSGCAIIRP